MTESIEEKKKNAKRDEKGRFVDGGDDLFWRYKPEKKEPEPGDAQQIYRLAAAGHGTRSIAAKMQIGKGTFYRWLKDHPEIKEAYDAGMGHEEQELLSGLRTLLKYGNAAAGIFLLKSRHGYREGETQVADNRIQVQLTLPAALSSEQYRQVLDVAKTPELPGGGGDDNG